MTKKTKEYKNVKFPYPVISEALKMFHRLLTPKDKKYYIKDWHIGYSDVRWKYDNEEQFRTEYTRDQITYAEMRLHTTQANFTLTYSMGYKTTNTTVSVEFSSIDKIEKVFSLFDENYEKYKETPKEDNSTNFQTTDQVTKQEETKPKIPLPKYQLEAILPSILVDITTVVNLEKYILQRASQLDKEKEDDYLIGSRYTLTIVDSQGTSKASAVSLFSKDMFDSDTSSINLNYGKPYGSGDLEIDVTFSPNRDSSELKITYKGESARDIVQSIKLGIFNLLKENKINNSFYHSKWAQSLFAFSLTAAILVSLQQKFAELFWPAAIIISIITFFFSLAMPLLKPYSVFDSKKSRSFMGWNRWLVELILGSLITWILFTLLIPYLVQ
jgi:hypothetical protein